MNRLIFGGLCAAAVLAGSAVLAAQTQTQMPDAPAKGFGTSITGAYEGWFDNPDGTHTFLVGYYNRNIKQAIDIPIGPNNRIEPGGPDMGQPTHFLASRQTGVFTITVPKAFTPEQRLTWTIVANGIPTSIPLRMNIDYNVSPFSDLAVGNKPPVVKLEENGPTTVGPIAAISRAVARSTSVSAPLTLNVWAEDDAKYSSGTNAPMRNPPPPVTIVWSKYRGTGSVTFDNAKPKLEVLAGGQVNQPFKGKATSTAKFSEPGEYVIQLVANDYSGDGGGGEVCCWTTLLVKVNVTP